MLERWLPQGQGHRLAGKQGSVARFRVGYMFGVEYKV
jgi:hypothetical protein